MKINVTISLDEGVVYKLKAQNNYSNLVNDQLKAYFEGVEEFNLGKLKEKQAKTKQIIKKSIAEAKVLDLKIKKIEEKESKILSLGRKYPDIVFKYIDSSTDVMKFYAFFRSDHKLKRYTWMELKKLYNQMKGGGSK